MEVIVSIQTKISLIQPVRHIIWYYFFFLIICTKHMFCDFLDIAASDLRNTDIGADIVHNNIDCRQTNIFL